MLSSFIISRGKNGGAMEQFIHANALGLAASDQFTHSIPFQCTLSVTKNDVMANADMTCHFQIQIQNGT